MRKSPELSVESSDTSGADIYLPAVSLPPRFERVERAVSDLFGRRGFLPVQDYLEQ
jgi:hypothetical protein